MNEERIVDLERFLKQNQQLKGKWCVALDEITGRFQSEFDQLLKMERVEGESYCQMVDGGVE